MLSATLRLVAILAACGAALVTIGCGSALPTGSGQPVASPAADANTGGDIPDNQAYVPVTPSSAVFTIKVPEGWARADEGGAIVFTDKLNRIRLETVQVASPTTVRAAQTTELPAIKAAATGFQGGQVTTVRRHAGTAVLIAYQVSSAPDPVTGKVVRDAVERYEFWRNGTEAIVVLSGPATADNRDPWRTITDSFQWR
jgi:hypothetical protein